MPPRPPLPPGVQYSRHDRDAPPPKKVEHRALLIEELKHYIITGKLPKRTEEPNEQK
jgi:hypothetical protein